LTTDHPRYSSDRFLSIHDLQTNHRHVLRSDHIQILNAILADQIRDHKQAHHNNISSFAISLVPWGARTHTKNSVPFSFSLQEVGRSFCSFAQWISFSLSFLLSSSYSRTDRLAGDGTIGVVVVVAVRVGFLRVCVRTNRS
jgi:hypothetical protein